MMYDRENLSDVTAEDRRLAGENMVCPPGLLPLCFSAKRSEQDIDCLGTVLVHHQHFVPYVHDRG